MSDSRRGVLGRGGLGRGGLESRVARRWAFALFIATAALLAGGCAGPLVEQPAFVPPEGATPYTNTGFQNDPDHFQFAIVGDRTGGMRPGVFRAAVERLNWLQPEFVVSVGDLISGYSEDEAELEGQWAELDSIVAHLDMPFFYVAGNHDMGNEAMRALWRERMGRDYYHFVYRNVLFIALNTEDPPIPLPKETLDGIAYFRELMREDPEKGKALLEANRDERKKIELPVAISDEQVAWAAKTLEEHPGVRWTLVFMHKPAWEYDSANFERIEALLEDRAYTMFAGHQHNYVHTRRKGRDYIRMGTAGGVWHHEGPGNMDHVSWVTMSGAGPIVTNLLLNGIIDEQGPTEHLPGAEFLPDPR